MNFKNLVLLILIIVLWPSNSVKAKESIPSHSRFDDGSTFCPSKCEGSQDEINNPGCVSYDAEGAIPDDYYYYCEYEDFEVYVLKDNTLRFVDYYKPLTDRQNTDLLYGPTLNNWYRVTYDEFVSSNDKCPTLYGSKPYYESFPSDKTHINQIDRYIKISEEGAKSYLKNYTPNKKIDTINPISENPIYLEGEEETSHEETPHINKIKTCKYGYQSNSISLDFYDNGSITVNSFNFVSNKTLKPLSEEFQKFYSEKLKMNDNECAAEIHVVLVPSTPDGNGNYALLLNPYDQEKNKDLWITANTFELVTNIDYEEILEENKEEIPEENKCESIFGEIDENGDFAVESLGYWLKLGMDIIKYVAIAALIILSSIDFFKAMISKDKDAMKTAGITAAKRFVYALLIFFLPVIIEIIMKQFGVSGTCGIE